MGAPFLTQLHGPNHRVEILCRQYNCTIIRCNMQPRFISIIIGITCNHIGIRGEEVLTPSKSERSGGHSACFSTLFALIAAKSRPLRPSGTTKYYQQLCVIVSLPAGTSPAC